MKSLKIALMTLLFSFTFFTYSFAEGESGIAVNPTGFITDGLSYLEYEKMTHKWISFAFRADYYSYDEEEREGDNYLYTESASAFGGGISSRVYFFSYYQLSGFYMGVGSEFLSVNWEWEEDDYGTITNAEGSDFTWGIHFQMGLKLTFDKFFVDPSFYTGWFMLDHEDYSMGAFIHPSVAVGMRF